jgi:hypothetical protein
VIMVIFIMKKIWVQKWLKNQFLRSKIDFWANFFL